MSAKKPDQKARKGAKKAPRPAGAAGKKARNKPKAVPGPANPLRVKRAESAEEPPARYIPPPRREKRPPGRPTVYTDALREEVCRRLAKGESLRRICRDDHIPHIDTLLTWAMDPAHAFSEHYARARQIQAELLVDELKDIADDTGNDVTLDDKGNPRVNTDVIQRAKLRIQTRQWIGVKLLPKVYGDRVELTTPKEPVQQKTPEERQKEAQEVLKRWGAGAEMFRPSGVTGETVND